jgi:hypothetical protein
MLNNFMMSPNEEVARLEAIEKKLEAILKVLWAMHNEDKGIANKIEKELAPFREKKTETNIPETMVK